LARRRAKRSDKISSKAKGSIVEEIVAWLHAWPGVHVERNVPLPAHDDPSRKREVDVLLATSVAGYPVRFAIECKNEAAPIGSPKIDAFVGKLQDVGIPRAQGIYISASGYTKGATRRAEQAGIRVLSLRGLSAGGLKAAISSAAHQSVVFFLVVVNQVTFFTESAEAELPVFVDASGRLCGTIPHLVAAKWQSGEISSRPGPYDITLAVPAGWHVPDTLGRPSEVLKQEVYVKLTVCALAMSVTGQVEEYSLVDPTSSRTEKLGIKAFFGTAEEKYPLAVFDDAASLDRFLSSRQGFRITQRIKVPRIRYHSAYWPISRRAAEQIRAFARTPRFVDGQLVMPTPAEVEGLDIAAAFEAPMTLDELDEFLLSPLRSRAASQSAPASP
jgi:hypothetical protein